MLHLRCFCLPNTYVCIYFYDPFVATYQRFDGIILPEHIKEPQSSSKSSNREDPATCNGVKLSSFDYKTKDLKLVNHQELRKIGLSMHLQSIHDVLVGTESMDDPIKCVDVVCGTYLSLHKNYLCYRAEVYESPLCHKWEFNETAKVN